MGHMIWSSLSANGPAFHVFRRDDAVFRTLQGSQVAVHEYRMAYSNLLAATQRERDDLVRDKRQLEDEVRSLTMAKAEADRLLKGHISGLDAGLRASEQAYSELDAKHQRLQHSSAEVTNELLNQVDKLQQTVAGLKADSQTLQTELASVQAEAALKDAAMQQVGTLQNAISALQQRARQLLADLKRGKKTAEKRVAELSSHLTATQEQLAQEAAARTSNDEVVRQLVWEREKLASALEMERLINEPLRHTTYATTTTMTHLMRSQAAPTVIDRASPDRQLNKPQHQHHELVQPCLTAVRNWRPGSAPPVTEATTVAAHASTRDRGACNIALSPRPGRRGAASLGYITGRNLTRLGRSWATTTATAGPPNPYFLDNLHSPLSPPPPGPARKKPILATPSHSPQLRESCSGGSGRSTATGTAGHRYVSPQYLTAMLRSPQTPYLQDSTAWHGSEASTEGLPSPTFLWRDGAAPSTPTASRSRGAVTPSSPSSTGRSVPREALKGAGSGGTMPPRMLSPAGGPVTIAYG